MQQWKNYHVAKDAVLVLQDLHLHDERMHKSVTITSIAYLHPNSFSFPYVPYGVIRPTAGLVVYPAFAQETQLNY